MTVLGTSASHGWRRTGLALLLLLGAGAGCAVNRRPARTVPELLADGRADAAADVALHDSVVARLARRLARRGDRTLDVLVLSGGGQNGAYGAGFLAGWRDRGDLPAFDLVTGISTGALQAPFALVGTRRDGDGLVPPLPPSLWGGPAAPAAFDTLRAVYLRSVETFAPRFTPWVWFRRTGGVMDATRFRRTLRDLYGPPMLDALREEFARDRQVLVASTDYDLGVGRVWDLAAVVAPRDSAGAGTAAELAVARTTRVLAASSAMPLVLPPVVVDGHVHADGGVTMFALPVLSLDDLRVLAERVRAREATVTVRLWVVMNTWMHGEPRVIRASRLDDMAQRTMWLQFWTHLPQLVQGMDQLARAATASIPGLQVELRVSHVPSPLGLEPDALSLFKASWIARLDSVGYARGRSGVGWDPVPSAYRRPD